MDFCTAAVMAATSSRSFTSKMAYPDADSKRTWVAISRELSAMLKATRTGNNLKFLGARMSYVIWDIYEELPRALRRRNYSHHHLLGGEDSES